MKIVICYIAVTHGRITDEYCARFVTTYREYPPGVGHDLMVICNGGPLPTHTSLLFTGINAKMYPRSNDGWDVGAYIEAAKGPCADYDIMVCLGESVYFHRAGWLLQFERAWKKHGPGMYGPFSSNNVRAHLGTTAFCCHPSLLKNYPRRVQERVDRYEFEHGETALWRRAQRFGMPVKLVTWDGEWEPRLWRFPPNILYRGDQSNLLMFCNHSDGFANATPQRRVSWARRCDGAFR